MKNRSKSKNHRFSSTPNNISQNKVKQGNILDNLGDNQDSLNTNTTVSTIKNNKAELKANSKAQYLKNLNQEQLTPSGFKKWLPMLVISLALAIIVIDGTILNVSQKAVINELSTDIKTIQFTFTSYSLVIAALTIFGGRLGDLFGRLKMFRIGAILFALGSLLTAVAPNVGILIIGWSLIEGIGAALMSPAASALIVSNYSGKDRGTAFAIFGATAGAAAAIGPIFGGFLAKYGQEISNFLSKAFSSIPVISTYFQTFGGWRWAFGINVFIVFGLLYGSRIIKDFTQDTQVNYIVKKPVYLDLPGVLLSSLGLTSIVYGFIESSTYGFFAAKKNFEIFGNSFNLGGISISFYTILLGLGLLVLFSKWEKSVISKGLDPLVNLDIFKIRNFSYGIFTLTSVFAGFTGIITYGLIFYYLTVFKYDSLQAGLALIPFSITTIIMAPLSAKLVNKYGAKPIIQSGLVLLIIGSVMFYLGFSKDATILNFIPGSLVFGSGFGLLVAQINNVILSSVDNNLAGVASGINGTVREIGKTLGIAIIGAAFISTLGSTLKTNLESNQTIRQEAKTAIIKSIDSGEVNVGTKSSQTDQELLTDAYKNNILPSINSLNNNNEIRLSIEKEFIKGYRETENLISTEVNNSITESSKQSIIFTGMFCLLALLFSIGIKNTKKV